MPKLTKRQAINRTGEVESKCMKLVQVGYMSINEFGEVQKIMKKIRNRLK